MQNFISDYLDILVFAAIAIVLLWRLRSVLGTRQENELPGLRINTESNTTAKKTKTALKDVTGTVQFDDKSVTAAKAANPIKNWTQNLPDFTLVASATAHSALLQFPAFDPEFRPDEFMDKAKKTFGLVVQAYAAGNKNTLEMLLSPELLRHFAEQIDKREQSKETYFTQLHGLQKSLISDATLEGSKARITVDFIAEQSITHKNADGNIVDARDGKRVVTKDRWIFTRDLKASSPFWIVDTTLEHAE